MSRTQIEPFSEEHLPGAAQALAARHERHRARLPLVSPDDALARLRAFRADGETSGAVALADGRVTAFILARLMTHALFGRCAWVAHPGHAAEESELLRDVYAAAADGWAREGAEIHYVYVPAHSEALGPWYRLGFGHMHVEGLRPLATAPHPAPLGVRLRLGTRADLEVAEEIDLEIYMLQARSPSFSRLPLDREARRQEWFEMNLKEDGLRYLVAEEKGELLGHTIIFRPEPVLGVPPGAAYLASTAVREGERGRGIGAALVAEVLRLAVEAGYTSVFTNWRMTNLSASRFWPAQGFQPIYHRLHRALGSG